MSKAEVHTPCLIFGEDDFAVKGRSLEIWKQWGAGSGSADEEILEGAAANAGEACQVIAKVHEALQTLPFFGGEKLIWLRNCNFLGDDRTSSSATVGEAVQGLTDSLKSQDWNGVKLLISAGKVDRRKSFYKTLSKLGTAELFAALSWDDRDWAGKAEMMARALFRELGQPIHEEALSMFVAFVGPDSRSLHLEAEKLSLYRSGEGEITPADVEAVTTRSRHAEAFALGEAVGERNLPLAIQLLDEELWSIRQDSRKSEIGLLYGLISKTRSLLWMREMARQGWIKPGGNFTRFKHQLELLPEDELPEDKRWNPKSQAPYVLFKALPQAANYTFAELIGGMELWLQCNRDMVSSSSDAGMVLQRTLLQFMTRKPKG